MSNSGCIQIGTKFLTLYFKRSTITTAEKRKHYLNRGQKKKKKESVWDQNSLLQHKIPGVNGLKRK